MRIYGEKLKKAIKNVGLKQIEVANKTSIYECQMTNLLKTGKTSDKTLIKIIDVLNEEQKIIVDEERFFIKRLNKDYTYNDFFKC